MSNAIDDQYMDNQWAAGFICGALAGALLGASAALLAAPRSGRSTRRRLMRELDHGVERLRDKGEELLERGEELVESGKRAAQEVAALRG